MTEEFKQKKLAFASINQLNGETFIIPDYQRGYRWQPTQVEQLLNDLWEFAHSHQFTLAAGQSPYCLQPIVVSQRENGQWEVIDGQQRLTTIWLILDYIDETVYDITFETRNEQPSNMDMYYRKMAKNVIQDWFKTPKQIGNSTYDEKWLKRKFVAILGLIPTCHDSGDKKVSGEKTFRGNKHLGPLIVEASWTAIHRDYTLGAYYTNCCQSMKPQKAIIKVARKLACKAYAVMKTKKAYVLA
jgi:hypothetical protein